MAKILAGPLASAASGRVGDLVFYTSHFGAGVRIFAGPSQPDTTKQKGVKSGLKALAHDWDNKLNESQRQNWISLAGLNKRQDRFLQTFALTGLQQFVACNQALAAIGVAEILDCVPAKFTITTPTRLTATWAPPNGPLTLDPYPEPQPTEVATIYATACQPAGRRVIKNIKRLIGHFGPGAAGPYTITSIYLDTFLAIVPGRVIGLGLRFTSNVTGAQSAEALTLQLTSP